MPGTGVRARCRDDQGRTVRLRVRSRAVVVAMGTFFTPLFLRRQGIRNRHLGRHLTLHPAGVVTSTVQPSPSTAARRGPA